MKQNEFLKLLKAVVKEEVQKQLPKVVTEVYLKKIVNESIRTTDSVVENDIEDYDENEVPKMMKNTNKGIYNSSGTFKRKNEVVNRIINSDLLDEKKNPFAEIYKDIQVEEQAQAANSVQLGSFDFERIAQLNEAVNSSQTAPTPIKQTSSAIEREIEMRRKRLEEQFVDTSKKGYE